MQRRDAFGRWLDLAKFALIEQPHTRDAVCCRSTVQFMQPLEFVFAKGDDDLAALVVWQPALGRVGLERDPSGRTQRGLQRARGVVDPGMDDATVATGLVSPDRVFLLEHADLN